MMEEQKIGQWTPIALFEQSGKRYTRFLCVCCCGKIRAVYEANLRRGLSKTCGCIHVDQPNRLRHGDSVGRKVTPEYRCWTKMKERCYDEKAHGYENYGGRGIKVCKRWLNAYENFLADMGRKPSPKYSIERKDNNGNYTPLNCCWATKRQQARNRRPRRHAA